MIETTAALAEACTELAKSEFITIDTEFLRETTFWPELCLVQMASPTLEVLVDPLAKGLDLTPLFELMANPDVVKVFHAARQDIEIIYHLGGLIPHPIFDTQVAAMVCGFGDSISYDQTGPEDQECADRQILTFHGLEPPPADGKAAGLCAGRRHPSARYLSGAQGADWSVKAARFG